MLVFESLPVASALKALLPTGLTDADNVREILGTLITSIISLVVFSFSMVMVVLNGAAARLSPRVLPGLISDTRNRIILGVNLGSVLFFLTQIILVDKSDPQSTPTLGVLLSLATAVLCLTLFVEFIRSVSQSIRVDWVMNQLFEGACSELKKRKQLLEGCAPPPDDSHWWCLRMRSDGYLQDVDEHRLCKLLVGRDLVARVQVEPGFFLVEGHPLIRFSAPLSDEEADEAHECFGFSNDEYASSNAAYGMRQLSEIAVKAISPAINDPGTAIRGINLIGVLLARHMGVPAYSPGCFDGMRPRLYYRELSTAALLFATVGPVRIYGASDPQVMIAVFQCLKNALHHPGDAAQLAAYGETLRALREAIDEQITNAWDRAALNILIGQINELGMAGLGHLEPLAGAATPAGG